MRLGALLLALPLVTVGEDCSRFACRQLPDGRMDCADLIAGYAVVYDGLLKAAGYGES